MLLTIETNTEFKTQNEEKFTTDFILKYKSIFIQKKKEKKNKT